MTLFADYFQRCPRFTCQKQKDSSILHAVVAVSYLGDKSYNEPVFAMKSKPLLPLDTCESRISATVYVLRGD